MNIFIFNFYFSVLFAFLLCSDVNAFGTHIYVLLQRSTSSSPLHYNIPRKKELGDSKAAVKSYSPFKSRRINSDPVNFILSEVASADVSFSDS
jgi:hypothetical protein